MRGSSAKAAEKPVTILIESATVSTQPKGYQAERIKLRNELRHSHPDEAAILDKLTGSIEDRFHGDDFFRIEIEWIVSVDGVMKGIEAHMPLTEIDVFQDGALTRVKYDPDLDSPVATSFTLKASAALDLLKMWRHVSEDAVLGNAEDKPLDFTEEDRILTDAL